MAMTVGAIVLGCLIAALGYGVGAGILQRLRPEVHSLSEEVAFALPLGLGVIAYGVLVLGLFGQLKLGHFVILLLVLALFAVPAWRRIRTLLRRQPPQVNFRLISVTTVVVLFLLLIGLLTLLGALAPSSDANNDWDGLSYHLAVPKIWLAEGRIHYLPWVSHSNFPFTLEMLYLLGMGLQGQAFAKLFHWLCGLLGCLAIYVLGRRHWNARVGVLGAVMFSALPLVDWEATCGMNDLAVALFSMLALGAVLNWWQDEQRGWLWTAGLCTGLALGTKLFAVLILIFIAVAVCLRIGLGLQQGIPRALGQTLAYTGIALAVASPWYIKSAIWTGNPVYPFFYSIFGGRYWSAEAAQAYDEAQKQFGVGHGVVNFLALPWDLTMQPQRFSDRPDHPLSSTSIGAFFLALIPAGLLVKRWTTPVKFLLAATFVFIIAWFLTVQHLRYLAPILPVLCLLAGASVVALGDWQKWVGYAASIVTAVGCVVGLVIMLTLAGEWGWANPPLGMESNEHYLSRTLRLYPIYQRMVQKLPENARMIFYGETRGFYCPRQYLWGNHHSELILYRKLKDAQALLKAYRARKVTHLLITGPFWQQIMESDSILSRLLRQLDQTGHLKLVCEERGYRVYALQ